MNTHRISWLSFTLVLFNTLTLLSVTSTAQEKLAGETTCDGRYTHHLQGICSDGESLYWSFTTTLVKTDLQGRKLLSVPVDNHHGDLCYREGRVYVAVNLGLFNHPEGKADSWVYVYDSGTLMETARFEVQEAFHGAGGIGQSEGRFYVVGGLPEGFEENYVYEYDKDFSFIARHTIQSGHTHLGIQTATFANGRWWFGCYGSPAILLVTDAKFKVLGRYAYDCSLGIEAWTEGRLLSASGKCEGEKGCEGRIHIAKPDDHGELKLVSPE